MKLTRLTKKRLRGEAIFLRAWCSFNLLRMYGGKTDNGQVLGYPIVTHYITPEEAAHPESFSRDSYEDCVNKFATIATKQCCCFR